MRTTIDKMTQEAEFPTILAELVEKLEYRKGWYFSLENRDRGQGSKGLTLVILIDCVDTYNPDEQLLINHYMLVPAAAYDERSWRRWLFEQILLVERHEAAEFFQIAGYRPYAPHHGPGNDPYIIFEHGQDIEMRTSFRGVVREAYNPKNQLS